MKLAYLTRQFPFEYLGEAFLAPEVKMLAQLCEEVHVIPTRPQRRPGVFGDLGTIDVLMPYISMRTAACALAEAARLPGRTARALKCILAPRCSLSTKIKNLALFPKALAVARYVRQHGIDHVHAHWLTTPSTIAYVVWVMTDVAWSCTGHAHDVFSDNLLSEKAASAQFIRIISKRNRDAFNKRTGYRYAARTMLLHVGVTLPKHVAQPNSGEALRILCPARLHPMKGHSDLLHALAMMRDAGIEFHCDLAGDGELRDQIAARVSVLQLSRQVSLRGIVSHDELLGDIQCGRYDVVALASIEDASVSNIFEGIPVALVEAMASGIPCVSTVVGSIPELIDSQNGILVDQRHPAALAQALMRLAHDHDLRKRLGSAARKRIEDAFDVKLTTTLLYERVGADGTPELARAAAASLR